MSHYLQTFHTALEDTAQLVNDQLQQSRAETQRSAEQVEEQRVMTSLRKLETILQVIPSAPVPAEATSSFGATTFMQVERCVDEYCRLTVSLSALHDSELPRRLSEVRVLYKRKTFADSVV